MNLYEAIYKRKSTRNYSEEKLPRDTIESIKEEISSADRLYPELETSFKVKNWEELEDIITGLVGGYGKIKAPHYIIASSEDGNGYLENIGYTLEKVLLEITRLGIATCWMGSHFNKENLSEKLEIAECLEPVILIAFGRPEEGKNAQRSDSEEAKRKGLSEIIWGDMEAVPENWSEILDAARMAPSAMNSQPWRFEVKDEVIELYIESNGGIFKRLAKTFGTLGKMNRIDAGIALRHVRIAADQFSKGIKFQRMKEKEKEDSSYVISIIES